MTSTHPTPPVKPSRWYRCDYGTKTPDYLFAANRFLAVSHFTERAEARNGWAMRSESVAERVRPVKAPPAAWLEGARKGALDRAEAAVKHADWLRTELARHYPGHK